MSHHFVWHELMTPSPDAAPAFYAAVTQWGTQQFDGSDYVMWTAERGPMAGLMALPEAAKAMGAPPHWLGYVSTKNVDETAARAVALGGKIYVAPKDIEGAGRIAVLADPQGAVFGVHSSNRETPYRAPGYGEFSWAELMTTDPAAAYAFYSELFGWAKTMSMDMGPMGTYQMFGLRREGPAGAIGPDAGLPANLAGSDKSLGGFMGLPPNVPAPTWLYYVTVKNLDAALEAVRANGGRIAHGPQEIPGNARVATCIDPQGAAFALHSEG